MKACVRSLQEKETPDAKALFVHLINLGTSYSNRFVRQYLIRALSRSVVSHRSARACEFRADQIQSRGRRNASNAPSSSWPAALSKQDLFGSEGLGALAGDDLLTRSSRNTPAAGLEFEHFLTLARRALLADALSTQATDKPIHRRLRFCCAPCAAVLHQRIRLSLRDRRNDGAAAFATQSPAHRRRTTGAGLWIAAFACYCRCVACRLPAARGCDDRASVAALYQTAVSEPIQEINIAPELHKADAHRRSNLQTGVQPV
jgi:hypothetical protein